jgi:hypothetical protein
MDLSLATFVGGSLDRDSVTLLIIASFCRREFVRCSRGFVMHRKRYATDILKRFDMVNCNHAVTPYEPRLQLSKCEDENSVDTTKFRSLIQH